jgi:hypothetical protein
MLDQITKIARSRQKRKPHFRLASMIPRRLRYAITTAREGRAETARGPIVKKVRESSLIGDLAAVPPETTRILLHRKAGAVARALGESIQRHHVRVGKLGGRKKR